MRVWDLPVRVLCRQHLLGEHRELHAVWAVLTGKTRGYSSHPETLRWHGRMAALARRHQEQVIEMGNRNWPSGFEHKTELRVPTRGRVLESYLGSVGKRARVGAVNSLKEQVLNVWGKGCGCDLSRWHKRFGLRARRPAPSPLGGTGR